MTFPVFINLFGFHIHPHLFFESLSYFIGFRIYLWFRVKERLPKKYIVYIIAGAIMGAAIGSKLLFWLENPLWTIRHWNDFPTLMGGKTIVGGLLGGLFGVEFAKKKLGWTKSTGDDFVLPLVIGMSIGRIGCFLTGLDDHTHGNQTYRWLGVDFGDGIYRHPTQLYEIAFLIIFYVVMRLVLRRRNVWSGFQFQLFYVSYLIFRFAIDFIKPVPHVYLGLNNIQIAAIGGLIYLFYAIQKSAKSFRGTTNA